jgi:menaquinone-dependent protoporphyrinogen IX oxidase
MKILNLYFLATGNTEKIAKRIESTLLEIGQEVETVKVIKDMDVEIVEYDSVSIGSGVYKWMPGKPFHETTLSQSVSHASKTSGSLLQSLRKGLCPTF